VPGYTSEVVVICEVRVGERKMYLTVSGSCPTVGCAITGVELSSCAATPGQCESACHYLYFLWVLHCSAYSLAYSFPSLLVRGCCSKRVLCEAGCRGDPTTSPACAPLRGNYQVYTAIWDQNLADSVRYNTAYNGEQSLRDERFRAVVHTSSPAVRLPRDRRRKATCVINTLES
jgi:hypothetical protein